MQSLKTLGVVLKGMDFGEADKILTIFTERLGKIKAIAKGVRKIKSRLAGSLEPFMLVDLQLHEGKTFYIVTGAIIRQEFPKIHAELDKMSKIFYVGELIDRFCEEKERNEGLLELLTAALEQIEGDSSELSMRAFELKLIESAGFKPELYECVHCKVKITPNDNFWDAVEGGLICAGCQVKHKHGQMISDNAIKLLRFFERQGIEEILRLKIDQKEKNEVEKILGLYIESVLERALKSKEFLKEIGMRSQV